MNVIVLSDYMTVKLIVFYDRLKGILDIVFSLFYHIVDIFEL